MTKYEVYANNMTRAQMQPEPFIYWKAMRASGFNLLPKRLAIIGADEPRECGVCESKRHVVKIVGRWCCKYCESALLTYNQESHRGNVNVAWSNLLVATVENRS